MSWNEVPPSESIPRDLQAWKKIFHLFPPSFYDVWVWVTREEKRRKAHFDASNMRWVKANKDGAYEILYGVRYWKEIKSNTLQQQSKELDDFLDRREEVRKSQLKND